MKEIISRIKAAFHILVTGHSLNCQECMCIREIIYGTSFIRSGKNINFDEMMMKINPEDTPFQKV